jgi:O-antigen/teichoic acid export membrane protein
MNPFALRHYLRLTPFDVSSELGRTQERYRRAAWTVLANAFSKSMLMLQMVLGVSLTVPYLGAERFGIWMTVAGFAGMLAFLDLGVGNALTTHVAERAAKDDYAALRRAISGGLGFLLLVALVVGTVLPLLIGWLPWSSLIKVDHPALLGEAKRAAILFGIFFGLVLFTTGIQKVFAGLQRSYEAHLAVALGTFASIAGLWMLARQQAGIQWLLMVTLSGQCIVGLLLLAILMRRKLFSLINIFPNIIQESQCLLHASGAYLILQIGCMLGMGADTLIISSTLGAAQVAAYSVTQRLFQFVYQPLTMVNAPLWGAYADAYARGDGVFIGTTLRKSLLLTFLMSLTGVSILLLLGDWMLRYWTHGKIVVSFGLIIAFAAWTVFDSVLAAFAMFLNGCRILRPQVIAAIVLTFVSLPLKFYAAEHSGSSAVVFVYLIFSIGVSAFLYGGLYRHELLARLK